MSAIHLARSGYITKSALPSVTRTRTVAPILYAKFDEAAGSTTPLDSSPYANTMTCVGSALLSSAQARFGTTSLRLINTGDYVSLGVDQGGDRFNLAAENWTIEFWLYLNSLPSSDKTILTLNGTAASSGGGSNGFAQVRIDARASGSVFFLVGGTTSNTWIYNTALANNTFAAGSWQHVAAVRNGSAFNFYVNGTSRASFTSTQSLQDFNGYTLIGSVFASGSFLLTGLNGYVDALRIFKGAAIYTSNFTPPSSLPADTQSASISNAIYGMNQLK
jgi:hypothetical protein